MSTCPEHYGDNFILVIPVPHLEHTSDRPFCWDDSCPCKENQDAIHEVYQAYQEGLLSADDAARILQGRTI